MKVAFVAKGGAGKSTISALFIRHLVIEGKHVFAVDADINQHLAELIGAPFKPELALANDDHMSHIRTHLSGTNPRITAPSQMVKTTPPGKGSNLIRIADDDPIIARYATQFAPNAYFMHVGTYDEQGIGTACYHTKLSIFENIMSHTLTNEGEWIVADMVAGTDSFANALHVLFDVTFLIVEPTPESTSVFKQFIKLAGEAGTADRVYAIGNKVVDDDDLAYIKSFTGDKLVAHIPQDNTLRKLRQQGKRIESVGGPVQTALKSIEHFAEAHQADGSKTLQLLHKLHLHYTNRPYARNTFGDLTNQIDPEFNYPPG